MKIEIENIVSSLRRASLRSKLLVRWLFRVVKWFTWQIPRLLCQLLIVGIVLSVTVLLLMSAWITFSTQNFHTTNLEVVPHTPVWLLLGTSKKTEDGRENAFYAGRIRAMAELYHARKIDCVLISGDNTSLEYNEPIMIQNSLLELWVPAERMYLDYAWVRTLDSILRARDVFWLHAFIVVSQPFHTERAIYLARNLGLDVTGFDANSIPFSQAPKTYLRELFSRLVAEWDRYARTEQKIAWEPVYIEYDGSVRPMPKKYCTPRGVTSSEEEPVSTQKVETLSGAVIP